MYGNENQGCPETIPFHILVLFRVKANHEHDSEKDLTHQVA